MKEEERRLRNAVMKMRHRKLAAAFVTWRDVAETMKQSADLAGRSVSRMRNMDLYRAFSTWQERAAADARVCDTRSEPRACLPTAAARFTFVTGVWQQLALPKAHSVLRTSVHRHPPHVT